MSTIGDVILGIENYLQANGPSFLDEEISVVEDMFMSQGPRRTSGVACHEDECNAVSADVSPQSMSFRVFGTLLLHSDLRDIFTEDLVISAQRLRTALVKHSADALVAHYAHLALPDELHEQSMVLRVLDTVSGVVIMINGLTIGISSDIAWPGFKYLEWAFTVFFFAELMTKLYINGCRVTYFGPDWCWNWFDMIVVSLAMFDLLMEIIATQADDGFADISLLRLARLARLTRLMRLLRVLRLKVFKELMLMVKGVIAGVRTLIWAIVLLLFIVYAVGVLLRQTVGMEQITVGDKYGTILFDSVLSSMFLVFRLCMSDADLPDGTPLIGHMQARYGLA
eukprot:CAMPEP_0115521944 /NCGR_PEP_ID=MMETSP0271-20121206/79816_1 /TAXON_ID=71861 /ORGANISM="Scrippsiella trochoidea, Strain CCMP3099" /LENGTH=338 /DNA_ID=CAMNT_0002953209 /DNA_START=188 /DNA_END=1201 /DNA_ORIENTATION=-